MLNETTNPITTLPANYREARYMSVNERGVLVMLNLLSLIPMAISGLVVFGGLLVYHEELEAPLVLGFLPDKIPSTLGIVLILLVLPLHEWIHGQVIRLCGHKPRYGVKWMVLFATSDGAYFRRNEFIRIALAPLVVISLGGLLLMPFLPYGLAQWFALAVMLNAAGAIGDLWMTAVALGFDASALIRDEEDSMRIFTRRPTLVS
ncbi:MAG: DUF3267 domain-containing protein [Chloroflexi bacterium]|nr:DUF3267 domain-containing protein [Chloroflexota bacterium]